MSRGLAGWWPALLSGTSLDLLAWSVTARGYCTAGPGCSRPPPQLLHVVLAVAFIPLAALTVYACAAAAFTWWVTRGQPAGRHRFPLPPGWTWYEDTPRPPPDDDPDWRPGG